MKVKRNSIFHFTQSNPCIAVSAVIPLPPILRFATIMKPRRCDIQLVGARRVPRDANTLHGDANVISLEIFMRARGWRTRIGFGAGAGDGGWAVYLRRRFSAVFLPLAISRCAMRPGPALFASRRSRLWLLYPFLPGRSPGAAVVPRDACISFSPSREIISSLY